MTRENKWSKLVSHLYDQDLQVWECGEGGRGEGGHQVVVQLQADQAGEAGQGRVVDPAYSVLAQVDRFQRRQALDISLILPCRG